jgi:hypothetical protein
MFQEKLALCAEITELQTHLDTLKDTFEKKLSEHREEVVALTQERVALQEETNLKREQLKQLQMLLDIPKSNSETQTDVLASDVTLQKDTSALRQKLLETESESSKQKVALESLCQELQLKANLSREDVCMILFLIVGKLN